MHSLGSLGPRFSQKMRGIGWAELGEKIPVGRCAKQLDRAHEAGVNVRVESADSRATEPGLKSRTHCCLLAV